MAILSASRRTDIPAFFGEWFVNRLKEGFLMVRNPYNNVVYKVPINHDVIDCIVFWTKNARLMMPLLDKIDYPYYFQFTLNAYEKDMERICSVETVKSRIDTFHGLSEKINGNVIWRYDPIIFTKKYSPQWHIKMFGQLERALKGYTKKCVISFVDLYGDVQKNIGEPVYSLSREQMNEFAAEIAAIAISNGMMIGTCAEAIDLDFCGIQHNKCIDPDYIEELIGCPIKAHKDNGQRKACGCIESVEVGTYNTCIHGCKYCYACQKKNLISRNFRMYDPNSPLLCDRLHLEDVVKERKLESLKIAKQEPELEQISLF